MAELKSIRYVGGRTPNAFPNNPVETLMGVRIFPARWWGMSAWYRAHLNQQGDRPYSNTDYPAGFQESSDPHGFGFQIFAGRRNERAPAILPNQPPVVTLTSSSSRVVLAAECGPNQRPAEGCTPTDTTVRLSAQATDPDGDTLLYTYSTNGGRVVGDGPNALSTFVVAPGTYTVTVEVTTASALSFAETTTVERCTFVEARAGACPRLT